MGDQQHTLHELSFASLKDLDNGKIPAAFDVHLQKCLLDLQYRPADDKPRTITMTVKIHPEMEEGENGGLAGVLMQAQVKSKMPEHKSKVYQMDVRKKKGQPQAVFSEISNDGSPTMFDQEKDK